MIGPLDANCGDACTRTESGLTKGSLRAMHGDTGVFFSTNALTAVTQGGSPGFSIWDSEQIHAFSGKEASMIGRGAATLVKDAVSGAWVGVGSMVAGNDSYYTNEFHRSNSDGPTDAHLRRAGPWIRIACTDSRVGGNGEVLAEGDWMNEDASLLDDQCSLTLAGVVVSPDAPLPANTNAIRAALGAGVHRSLRVQLRVVGEDQQDHWLV